MQLLQSLVRGVKVLETRLDAQLAQLGLSLARWTALRELAESKEGLSLGQLAEQLSCVKSNVTQLVDRLEADRLVHRVPDPDDRRSVRAELTPEGRRQYEAGLAVMQEFERHLQSVFNTNERHLLGRLFSWLGSDDPVRI